MVDLVVVGAGGFGREALDIVDAARREGASLRLVGVVDLAPRESDYQRLAARGIPYLGTEDEWLRTAPKDVRFVVGIGNPVVREAVVRRLSGFGLRAVSVVHPEATLGSDARIGEGVVIAAGVRVSTNVSMGDHVHLNPGAIIGHDTSLADYVSVNPGAIVSGAVVVGRSSLLGAGSVTLQGLTVGERAVVGAAACVVRDVPDGTTVVGIPAQRIHATGTSERVSPLIPSDPPGWE